MLDKKQIGFLKVTNLKNKAYLQLSRCHNIAQTSYKIYNNVSRAAYNNRYNKKAKTYIVKLP